jgi:hypothetical protein
MGNTFWSTSVKNSAAPGRDVIEIVSPPHRNQCVEPPREVDERAGKRVVLLSRCRS